jgi:pimeloyl-ACP methyl ester carboxylesterase
MELKEGFFDNGEMRLHYLEGPQAGPPLVLVHGATGTCQAWDTVLPTLAQRWHVYSVDLRGHGKSGRADGPEGYHVSACVDDILAFLHGRVEGPAVLVGHSWGAVVSLLCGAPGKDVLRALVLEDPPISIRRPNQESKQYTDYFGWLYQLKQIHRTIAELSAALQAANGGALPPEQLAADAQRIFDCDANFLLSTLVPQGPVKGVDFAAEVREIACPILLLQADLAKGAALLPEDLDLVMENARNARVVRFPGAGHGIHLEQPAEFLMALETFFQFL